MAGKSRCLSRLGRFDEAIEECQKAAFAAAAEKRATRPCASPSKTPGSCCCPCSNNPAHRRCTPGFSPDHQRADRRSLQSRRRPARCCRPTKTFSSRKKVLEVLRRPFRPMTPRQGTNSKSSSPRRNFPLPPLKRCGRSTARSTDSFKPTSIRSGSVAFATGRHRPPCWCCCPRLASPPPLSGYHDTFAGSESAYRILDAAGDFVAGTPQPRRQTLHRRGLARRFPRLEGGIVFSRRRRFREGGQTANRRLYLDRRSGDPADLDCGRLRNAGHRPTNPAERDEERFHRHRLARTQNAAGLDARPRGHPARRQRPGRGAGQRIPAVDREGKRTPQPDD